MSKLPSYDPSTGELVGEVPVTPPEAIGDAVSRARQAQPAWEELGTRGRAEILARAGQRILERAQETARLVTREMGKPLREALSEVESCGKGAPKLLEEVEEALAPQELEDERTRSTIYRDPLGVCAAITPWNFPFAMPHWMVFPALATGNTVVLKPSEETPLCGQAYADILCELLPEGVLQVVHGADDQGKALVDADIDIIAFTGSRETGKKILGAASGGLKRVILELGGKDPLVVLEDADLSRAARFAAQNSFRNAGQVCVSTERIFVPKKVADQFVDLLREETAKLKVGSGLDDDTRVGPMVSQSQREHVLRQIDEAVSRGARIAIGGEGHRENFVTPTVLTGVTEEMSIAREETFGPVACVTVVEDEAEAVSRANDSRFGLGAVVFGTDEERTTRAARRLKAGMVGINKSVGGAAGTPWVGARESGYSFHSSVEGHRNFTQTRVLSRPR